MEDDKRKGTSSLESQFAEEFGWYPMLYSAASENFLDIDKVLEKDVREFLNHLNYLIRKNELERLRIERASR